MILRSILSLALNDKFYLYLDLVITYFEVFISFYLIGSVLNKKNL